MFSSLLVALSIAVGGIGGGSVSIDTLANYVIDKHEPNGSGPSATSLVNLDMEAYFYHLGDNIIENNYGNCGFTAIGMLLSYYDSFWNDDIIPEAWDSGTESFGYKARSNSDATSYQSPGCIGIQAGDMTLSQMESYLSKQGLSSDSDEYKFALDEMLYDFALDEIDAGSLMGELLRVAIEDSVMDFQADNDEEDKNVEKTITSLAVNNTIMNGLIENYFADNNLTSQYEVNIITNKIGDASGGSDQIREEIIELVKEGYPVIVGGNGVDESGSGYGHDLVIYDYDSDSDTLYGNMGWGSEHTHDDVDAFFNIRYSDYWALDFSDVPTGRSDNMYLTDIGTYWSPGTDEFYAILRPEDYGFDDAYYSYEITTSKHLSSVSISIEATFTRLRCGYIQEEAINISTRRYSPGTAYLAVEFDNPIVGVDIELSWWSYTEYTYDYDSDYWIGYIVDGIQYEAVDLWDLTISKDRNNPTTVSLTFDSPVDGYVIYGQSYNPVNDRNKGRLSILNTTVVFDS